MSPTTSTPTPLRLAFASEVFVLDGGLTSRLSPPGPPAPAPAGAE